MDTLPQPTMFTCERCQEPIPFWDWGQHDVDAATPPTALCPDHLIETAPPEQQWLLRARQVSHQDMRLCIGKPPGTLVAWEVALSDKGGNVRGVSRLYLRECRRAVEPRHGRKQCSPGDQQWGRPWV